MMAHDGGIVIEIQAGGLHGIPVSLPRA